MNKSAAVYARKPFIVNLRKLVATFFCSVSCVACGKRLKDATTICDECVSKYFESFFSKILSGNMSSCSICGKELISEINTCLSCRRQKLQLDKNYALFPYIGIGQNVLLDWKNKGIRNYAYFFSNYILRFLNTQLELNSLAIVPVPPRPKKLKRKGWDQVNDIVAVLEKSGKTIIKALGRYDGVSQKLMGKTERRDNIKGKFFFKKRFIGKLPETVLLLDDIITSGSTILECSNVLKQNGCKKVLSLTLFFD